jgi:hypothetical protein
VGVAPQFDKLTVETGVSTSQATAVLWIVAEGCVCLAGLAGWLVGCLAPRGPLSISFKMGVRLADGLQRK